MVQLSAKAGPSKRAPSPIKVDDESKDEGEMTPAHSKGKVRAVPKKTRDALVHCLNHLHSRLYQIQVKVKELEVKHTVVMSEVSEIVEGLEDMDL